MTIRYGVYVGAVKQLVPMQPIDMTYARSKDQVVVRDLITLAAAPIADKIQLATDIDWESVLDFDGCVYHNGAMGAATTFTVGDVTFPAALDTGIAVNAAGKGNFGSAVALTNWYQPLWQNLGYATLAAAKAVAPTCTLFLTLAGAAFTGTLVWKLHGSRRG